MNTAPTTKSKCNIRVGTSGFSFPGWVGRFYPNSLPGRKMLGYYASRFDTVELNFSFYRMPTPVTTQSLVNHTPAAFRFFVKAHHLFTHCRDLSEADAFLAGITPLIQSEKMAGLLFQFPQSFKNNASNRRYLERLRSVFDTTNMAIEFRDRSWATSAALDLLEKNAMSLVSVDEPQISTLFPRLGGLTAETGYLRFHSRDGNRWYDQGRDRYDYHYSRDEMKEWIPFLETIAERARNIFIFFNNCHQAQAAQNAEAMKELIRRTGLAESLSEPETPAILTG